MGRKQHNCRTPGRLRDTLLPTPTSLSSLSLTFPLLPRQHLALVEEEDLQGLGLKPVPARLLRRVVANAKVPPPPSAFPPPPNHLRSAAAAFACVFPLLAPALPRSPFFQPSFPPSPLPSFSLKPASLPSPPSFSLPPARPTLPEVLAPPPPPHRLILESLLPHLLPETSCPTLSAPSLLPFS